MENIVLFSVSADVFCLLLCFIGAAIVWLWREPLGTDSLLLAGVFLTHGVQVISNLLGLLFRGGAARYIHGVLLVTNFVEFASGYVMSLLLTFYIIACIGRSGELGRWKKASIALCTVSLLLLVIAQFNGMYYTIDAENFYHRASLYWLSLLLGAASTMIDAALVIRYRERLASGGKFALGFYIILPALALFFQYFVYGIYILLLADTMALVVMFLIMLFGQTKRYYGNRLELVKTRLELVESRTAVMLSQIHPHFLFNSLTAISELCESAPGEAQKAVDEFAGYLRGNMDSLSQKGCIPFDEELRHTGLYLSLEKYRFQNRLQVEYNLLEKDFLIPMLTLQPIVENAVNHGITKRKEGGTIKISTFSDKTDYIITVFDNGVGFDPDAPPADNKAHVGLDNVRMRLLHMRGGVITVESSPGCGTQVTMRLPKRYADNKGGGRSDYSLCG